jgi:hypothetical protein
MANHDQITTALQKTAEDNPLNTADISVDPKQQTETIGLPDARRSSVRCVADLQTAPFAGLHSVPPVGTTSLDATRYSTPEISGHLA